MHQMQKIKKQQVATGGVWHKKPYHDVFDPFQVNPTKLSQFPWEPQQGKVRSLLSVPEAPYSYQKIFTY